MRKTADVQLRTVTEWRSRQAIERQTAQWTARLEHHAVQQFQLRCYAAALQATELPNPKVQTNKHHRCRHSDDMRCGRRPASYAHAALTYFEFLIESLLLHHSVVSDRNKLGQAVCTRNMRHFQEGFDVQ